jgi:hypothetical protein
MNIYLFFILKEHEYLLYTKIKNNNNIGLINIL